MPISDTGVILGSVGSSFLSAVGNVFGAKSQREYDRRMWLEQAEYNSPKNQVQRLRDAGVNPALALTNGSLDSGVMSGSAGGQSAPQFDFSPIAQGVRDSVDLYQQRRLNDAQIDKLNEESTNQSIRNRFENNRQIIELTKLLNDSRLSDSMRDYYHQEIDRLQKENFWIDKRNSSNIAKTDADAAKAKAETAYTNLMSSYQQIVNQYAPDQQRQLLSNLFYEGRNILAQAAEHGAGAALNAAERALTDAQKRGVDIDNKEKPRLARALADAAMANAREANASASVAQRGSKIGTLWTKFLGSDHEGNVHFHELNIQKRAQSGGVR